MSARHATAAMHIVAGGRLELVVDGTGSTAEVEVPALVEVVDRLNELPDLVDQLDAMADQLRTGAAAARTRAKRRQLAARAEGVELARNLARTRAERITRP